MKGWDRCVESDPSYFIEASMLRKPEGDKRPRNNPFNRDLALRLLVDASGRPIGARPGSK